MEINPEEKLETTSEEHPDHQELELLDRSQTVPQNMSRIRQNALCFFKGTLDITGLSQEARSILNTAISYKEENLPNFQKGFSPATVALIRSYAGTAFSKDEEQALLALIGLLTKQFRRENLASLGFSADQQRTALTLAAIIEIVQRLDDKKRKALIQSIRSTETDLVVILDVALSKKDKDAIVRKIGLWRALDYPELLLLSPDEARLWLMPYPEITASSGILPGDSLAEAGRKTMRFLFAHMLAHEKGTRQGEDIEALHDMRVATRRMRAAFEVYGMAFDKKTLKPHLNGFRQTGRALGAVRDLDVFMEKARKYIADLPEEQHHGLDPLLGHWADQREAARAKMLAHLNSRAYAHFKHEFNIFLNTPEAGVLAQPEGQIIPHLVRQLVPALVYERVAAVRAFETYLEDAPIELLHMLRIEFKKLRYTFEYFVEVLGKQAPQVIEDIKNLQDHLGDLNDADVAVKIIGDFLQSPEEDAQISPADNSHALDEVVNYLRYRQLELERLHKTFNEAWSIHFQNRAFRRNIARAVFVL